MVACYNLFLIAHVIRLSQPFKGPEVVIPFHQNQTTMKIPLSFFALALAASTAHAQCATIIDYNQTPAGSGAYMIEPIYDNPSNLIPISTWFYYPGSGTGNSNGYGHFVEPGQYTVMISVSFDDPNTTAYPDCDAINLFTLDIDCYNVGDAYPIVTIDTQSNTALVSAPSSNGIGPFSYTWTCDAPYTDLGDGTITVPLTGEGYMSGTLIMTDANGCFSWPHSFGATDTTSNCSLDVNTQIDGNLLTAEMTLMFGPDTVDYPFFEIDFGDDMTDSFFDIGYITHLYDQPGEYLLCITASPEGGMCENFQCHDIAILSANQTEHSFGLTYTIYPNPGTDHITISATDSFLLKMYNSTGQVVRLDKGYGTISLKTEDLPVGIYYVELKNEEGSKTYKWVKN